MNSTPLPPLHHSSPPPRACSLLIDPLPLSPLHAAKAVDKLVLEL